MKIWLYQYAPDVFYWLQEDGKSKKVNLPLSQERELFQVLEKAEVYIILSTPKWHYLTLPLHLDTEDMDLTVAHCLADHLGVAQPPPFTYQTGKRTHSSMQWVAVSYFEQMEHQRITQLLGLDETHVTYCVLQNEAEFYTGIMRYKELNDLITFYKDGVCIFYRPEEELIKTGSISTQADILFECCDWHGTDCIKESTLSWDEVIAQAKPFDKYEELSSHKEWGYLFQKMASKSILKKYALVAILFIGIPLIYFIHGLLTPQSEPLPLETDDVKIMFMPVISTVLGQSELAPSIESVELEDGLVSVVGTVANFDKLSKEQQRLIENPAIEGITIMEIEQIKKDEFRYEIEVRGGFELAH